VAAQHLDPASLTRWGNPRPDGDLHCRGTAVALNGQGVLIIGPSGSGKSGLALSLMALGAVLIADDGVTVGAGHDGLNLHRPATAPALIEARGIGLLHAGPVADQAPLALAIDLGTPPSVRIPPALAVGWAGQTAPLIHAKGVANVAVAVVIYLRHGPADAERLSWAVPPDQQVRRP